MFAARLPATEEPPPRRTSLNARSVPNPACSWTTGAFDALNRPTSITTPDASEIRPGYNEAGLLEAVDVRIRDASTWTSFVNDIDYDAKGQRERISYGNGTVSEHTYDPLVSKSSKPINESLPFFSKVALVSAANQLRGARLKVVLEKIQR